MHFFKNCIVTCPLLVNVKYYFVIKLLQNKLFVTGAICNSNQDSRGIPKDLLLATIWCSK